MKAQPGGKLNKPAEKASNRKKWLPKPGFSRNFGYAQPWTDRSPPLGDQFNGLVELVTLNRRIAVMRLDESPR
jgi:hypothetical protein